MQNMPIQENDYDTSISYAEELDQGWKWSRVDGIFGILNDAEDCNVAAWDLE